MPRTVTLSLADKLALTLTSAGSQRNLAATIGASHQQVSRWLKGANVNAKTGAITNEPRDPEVIAGINQAFLIHSEISRQQAKLDKIPFDPLFPIFAQRKALKNGQPGDRVIVGNTQYILRDFQQVIIGRLSTSARYLNVSIRSTIDIRKYPAKEISPEKLTEKQRLYRQQFKQKLKDGVILSQVYTPKTQLATLFENVVRPEQPSRIINDFTDKLVSRHEPATGSRGTHLADEILFQLIPANILNAQASTRTAGKAKRRAARKPKAR